MGMIASSCTRGIRLGSRSVDEAEPHGTTLTPSSNAAQACPLPRVLFFIVRQAVAEEEKNV